MFDSKIAAIIILCFTVLMYAFGGIESKYWYIYSPYHPSCTKKGYVAEHRLVAEKMIGRFINKDEDVHHINGNKTDNRPENLMVLSHSDHIKLHKQLSKREK